MYEASTYKKYEEWRRNKCTKNPTYKSTKNCVEINLRRIYEESHVQKYEELRRNKFTKNSRKNSRGIA